MNEIISLPILPEGVLTSSVITTVWVGVFVISFFNLRLGWTLSGVVIPGYLVPLMIAKPWAAIVVIIEGIITYLLVYFFSTYMSRLGYWSNLFGRDRFFAMIMGSLLVRIAMDGWLLPELGAYVTEQFQIAFDYHNNLRSFGLIITALIANFFWKSGLRRGLPRLLIIISITFLLVRFVLMEFSNFNIGRINYMYEDMVTSFLASPKAYIIIIVTSFFASRMNIVYGWEFSGIMIPSLLALQWYQPVRLISTFIEAVIILIAASLILKLPFFRNKTIEGARKLLLFFNIAFLYKFILGHTLLLIAPQVNISDYFGFGYLLSTLIAMKMHQRNFLPQMIRTILQTSLLAVLFASIIGFSLTFLSPLWTSEPNIMSIQTQSPQKLNMDIIDFMRQKKLKLYRKQSANSMINPFPPEIDIFERGLLHLKNFINSKDQRSLDMAGALFSQVNYRIDILQNRYLIVQEKEPERGWGVYVFDKNNPEGLTIEIPAPLDEWQMLEAGTAMFQELEGSSLGTSGTSRNINWDRSSDVLSNPQTFFHVFHRIMGRNNTLQLRGITKEYEKKTESNISRIYIKKQFPRSLSLTGLREIISNYDIKWEQSPMKSVQREQSRIGFVELFLNRKAVRQAMVSRLKKHKKLIPELHLQRIDGYLRERLLNIRGEIAEKGSGKFKALKLEELLFFDREIITPLLYTLQTEYKHGAFSGIGLQELRLIDSAANVLGYRLIWYRHRSTQQDYLILFELPNQIKRTYNGTYVFRLGQSKPYIIEIPRPLFEQNSFEYGLYIFERLKASALFIAGSNPLANADGSSDPLLLQNRGHLFNLVHQIILREQKDNPTMVIACRAFSKKKDRLSPGEEIFLATHKWASNSSQLTELGKKLYSRLKEDHVSIKFVDGSRETAGYEIGLQPQYLYLKQSRRKEYTVIWLSRDLRRHFRQDTGNRREVNQFTSLGIETIKIDLFTYILQSSRGKKTLTLPVDLKREVENYLNSLDVVLLSNLKGKWSQFTFKRIIDANTRMSFLLIQSLQSNGVPFIASLSPRLDKIHYINIRKPERKNVQRYIDTHSLWLLMKE